MKSSISSQRLRPGGAPALGPQRRAGRAHQRESRSGCRRPRTSVSRPSAARRPSPRPNPRPRAGRRCAPVWRLMRGKFSTYLLSTEKPTPQPLIEIMQRLAERVDALDRLVRAVVDADVVPPGGRAGHRQQPHRGHRPHLEDAPADPLVGLGRAGGRRPARAGSRPRDRRSRSRSRGGQARS